MNAQLAIEKVQAIGELVIDCEPYFDATACAGKHEEMVNIVAELEEFVIDKRLSESPGGSSAADESSQDIVADFGPHSTTNLTALNVFECPVEEGAEGYSSVNDSSGAKQQYPASWPRERIAEWDPDTISGESGVSGVRFRARNGHKDRGQYAGKMHLMSTMGHNPIAVPGGVELLLRERGIWGKYGNRSLSHDSKILFDKADQFRVHWIRRKDGTRVYVSAV
ncbi:MAG: hypothetical protein OXG68_03970 [Chloroflexi bacterium]|nr:hypothetical protein [Chloroflexota bacterium]